MIRSRIWLLAMAGAALAAVGAALVSQHSFGMQPCPWCVLQRAVFTGIAAVALIGAALPMAALRRIVARGVVVLAACGVAAALWQHFVAAASTSCRLTLADRIMSASKLSELWPDVFLATASCAEAKVDLFGLPYEAWSFAVFIVLGAAAARLLAKSNERRAR
jgi:disulfide bond formation protein DsbB